MLLEASCLLGVQEVAWAALGNTAVTASEAARTMALVLSDMLMPS